MTLPHHPGALGGPIRNVQRRQRPFLGRRIEILRSNAFPGAVQIDATGFGNQREDPLGNRIAADDRDVIKLLALRDDEFADPGTRIG